MKKILFVLPIMILLAAACNNQQAQVQPVQVQPVSNKTEQQSSGSEAEILASLKSNWVQIQTQISFRPTFHNQQEDKTKIWRGPSAVQFIAKDVVLVSFEDDDNAHSAIFKVANGKFSLSETFRDKVEFTLEEWNNLVKKYGQAGYPVATYTKDIVRDGRIINFSDLIKVPENIFIKGYWQLTADWKTYTNSKYGFELKYPAGWFATEGVVQEPTLYNLDINPIKNYMTANFSVNIFNLTLENEIEGRYGSSNYERKAIKINGREAVFVNAGATRTYVFDMNGKVLSIDLNYRVDEKINELDILHQILSTFKFTK